MLNDLLIRELAQSRINQLYETAEAGRLARLARNGRRANQVTYLQQLFASVRRGATRVAGGVSAAVPQQRSSTESRSTVTARTKSHASTQCC